MKFIKILITSNYRGKGWVLPLKVIALEQVLKEHYTTFLLRNNAENKGHFTGVANLKEFCK